MLDNKHYCIDCNIKLNDDNWYKSHQIKCYYICKYCHNIRVSLWKKYNPDMAKAIKTKAKRKMGHQPMNENKKCPLFLGISVAEYVLQHVFKDVEVMVHGNTGYDFICNHGKKIDVKSSCLHEGGDWSFTIGRNTIADYFLCIAFDNRDDLNPIHIWLLPGNKFNHIKLTGIRPSTISKWNKYKLNIDNVVSCCDTMKGN